MKVGFYPGSFDPFTRGHLHVVKRACSIFDKVIIGIGVNPNKKRVYSPLLMKTAIEETLSKEGIKNFEVVTYQDLSVDVAQKYNSQFLIRGIRNDMDYRYEENLAQLNEELSGLDTIYIRSGLRGFISSSMIVELLANGKDVSKYVPETILNYIKTRL